METTKQHQPGATSATTDQTGKGYSMSVSPFVSSRPSPTYNCVYYWEQDKQRWTKATIVPAYLGGTATTLSELKAEIIRAGRPAVLGNSNIGAPEGPPMA